MTAEPLNPYDDVPYPKGAHRSTHARGLEAMATLFGMQPEPLPGARILELGCASGWNLIPQAQDYPDAEFVGVDLSARQIADGRETIEALDLKNIQLRQADIRDFDDDDDDAWGQFDYILCHGVYSWVPADVQDGILAICAQNLKPQGVACVSFNVLPGWHIRGIARDLMCYHTAKSKSADEKLAQGRAILTFIAEYCPEDSPYATLLEEESNSVQSSDGAYVYHDYLEVDNHPCYFHEFMTRAAARKLQFLTDTDISRMTIRALPEKAQAALANLSLVQQQQYMDFLSNTTFRHTLLCHEEVRLERNLHRTALERFHLGFSERPDRPRLDVASKAHVKFDVGKWTVGTSSPFTKAALQHLIDIAPRAITIGELHAAAMALLEAVRYPVGDEPPFGVPDLAAVMMEVFLGGALTISLHPPRVASRISARPTATEMVRLQASQGRKVVSQLHETVSLDQLALHVVARLDGQHDLDWLSRDLRRVVESGEIEVPEDEIRSLEEVLDRCLERALLSA